jgi:hypothetical protein
MKQLEQILEPVNSSKYKSIDIYAVGTLALYTAPMQNFNFPLAYNNSPSSPYERQTSLYDYGVPPLPEFRLPDIQPINIPSIEGPGCIARNSYELDNGWKMQERFDFSSHNGLEPHINYDIMNPFGSVKPKISSNFLDNNHQINLGPYLK